MNLNCHFVLNFCRDTFRVLIRPDGFRFNGNGYAVVDRGIWRPDQRTDIVMMFRTLATDGLMLFMSKERDFLSIEMVDGKLLFQYDLGSGRIKLQSMDRYNDDMWHSLQASRRNRDGALFVDNIKGKETARRLLPDLRKVSVCGKVCSELHMVMGYPGVLSKILPP